MQLEKMRAAEREKQRILRGPAEYYAKRKAVGDKLIRVPALLEKILDATMEVYSAIANAKPDFVPDLSALFEPIRANIFVLRAIQEPIYNLICAHRRDRTESRQPETELDKKDEIVNRTIYDYCQAVTMKLNSLTKSTWKKFSATEIAAANREITAYTLKLKMQLRWPADVPLSLDTAWIADVEA
jgi:hypothetical protein